MEHDQNHPEQDQAQQKGEGATEPSHDVKATSESVEAGKFDATATVVTILVVGVGAALISGELLAGVLIGVAASFLPGFGRHVRPLLDKTVEAGSVAARKTLELVTDKSKQDLGAKAEPTEAPSKA